MGVHEHWNNSIQKQYHRNLGYPDGIELLKVQGNKPADFNEDGIVEFADFTAFSLSWMTTPEDEGWSGLCNLSDPKDEVIDLNDFKVFLEYWLKE